LTSYTMKEARSIVSTMLLGAQKEAARTKRHAHRPFVDLRAGEVHKTWLGGLKPNRMSMVCNAMRQLMRSDDVVLEQPPSGQGPRLRIRYYLEH
jgi:hypothetical protein